jgi:ribonuclease D
MMESTRSKGSKKKAARLPDPILVRRPAEVQRMARRLEAQPVVAVDTESNSLYAYQEQVCLIQFSIPGEDYLVDPLALNDLSALGPLFADPEIEKIFHAAEYDLICLDRDFGFQFANLFDTMVAARILGRDAIGLGSILEEEFGVTLNKRYQRANWGQRPLPRDLLTYARLDTHYLIDLRDELAAALERQNLMDLAKEDFRRLTVVNGRSENDDEKPPDCWRIKGAYDLSGQEAAILQSLCEYRDQVARRINRPLFKVINDRSLLAIAQAEPRDLRDLEHLPGMSARQVNRHGEALLEAVRRGQASNPIYPPRSPRPSVRFVELVDSLREWRKHTAQHLGVQSDVVLPRDLMVEIAEKDPRQMHELSELLEDVPWRMERFGQQILRVVKRA